MRSIIDDLLTLSRLEMDDQDPTDRCRWTSPTELRLIVHEAQALSEAEHRIETAIDPDLLLIGNPVELRSAFSNLIHNAVRHTPPAPASASAGAGGRGPPVQRAGRRRGHRRRAPAATHRALLPGGPGRSRASGGTGLGLAIVKHVLNRHDARLLIASEPGRGSRFACQFPRERAGSGWPC